MAGGLLIIGALNLLSSNNFFTIFNFTFFELFLWIIRVIKAKFIVCTK
jgi:hypothetical protein